VQRSSAQAQIEEQLSTNRSAIEHFAAFAPHRERLTRALCDHAAPEARLCVLGAGNCYDLDLAELTRHFREVHLVDLDSAALARASTRLDGPARDRLVCHAPVDLSGALERIDAWQRMQTSPEELAAWPAAAARRIAERLPGPFELVASTCLLSQLHFSMLNVLGDQHRLFEPVRQLLNLVHLRTLARLIAPSGRALLVNDLASDEMIAQSGADASLPPLELARELERRGAVIHVLRPGLLRWAVGEDPALRGAVRLSEPEAAWFWQVGPDQSFLVCTQLLQPAP
jgi:hypothetical protein